MLTTFKSTYVVLSTTQTNMHLLANTHQLSTWCQTLPDVCQCRWAARTNTVTRWHNDIVTHVTQQDVGVSIVRHSITCADVQW